MPRIYPIPPTRLPFVNNEIARLDVRGQRFLASAIWGGAIGGRVYFWNPVTGEQFMRELPDKIGGAYMMKTAADGRLYLGCGGGELLRYDAREDRFEVLVRGEFDGITWGGCIAGEYVIWSASPGAVGVYNTRDERLVKAFKPIDSDTPAALYAHRALPTPDGKVLLAMNVPQARLILLDLPTMSASSQTPPAIEGRQFTRDAIFLDNRTLALFAGGGHDAHPQELLLFDYPSLELRGRIANPPDAGDLDCKACIVDGYLWAHGRKDMCLYRLRLSGAEHAWERVSRSPIEGELLALHPFDETHVAGITLWGETILHDTRTSQTRAMLLDATGPLPAHALCAVPQIGRIIGAPYINQRFWEIDTTTGEGRDLGRAGLGSGQINQVVFDPRTRQALLSSYTTATIAAYRHDAPVRWPENPRPIASARDHDQMRPLAMVHDGTHVWMATNPQYGLLGGALCRLDPASGEMRVWRHMVRDCGVNSIVIDRASRRLYFGTNIWGDCGSAEPTQRGAVVAAFDMDGLALRRTRVIHDQAPWARVWLMLPGGELLVSARNEFAAWNPATDGVHSLGPVPAGMARIVVDADGRHWGATSGGIGRVHIGGTCVRFELRLPGEAHHLQLVSGTLYFTRGLEVLAIDLAELDEPLQGPHVPESGAWKG